MTKEYKSGITKIAVKGFKSIAEECEIDIRPLTILAGANNSGKSSIMQPLLMLKQTLEAPYDPGPLKIDGPNVHFTAAEEFLSNIPNETKTNSFQIQIDTRDSDFFESVTSVLKKQANAIEIDKIKIKQKSTHDPLPNPISYSLRPNMSSDEIKSILIKLRILGEYDTVKRKRCFLHLHSQHDERNMNLTQDFESKVINCLHVTGLTNWQKRMQPLTSTLPSYSGTFEHYAASIIHEWQEKRNERLKAEVHRQLSTFTPY